MTLHEMTTALPADGDTAPALDTEASVPVRQKRGVSCYWLPNGKCMLAPPPKGKCVCFE